MMTEKVVSDRTHGKQGARVGSQRILVSEMWLITGSVITLHLGFCSILSAGSVPSPPPPEAMAGHGDPKKVEVRTFDNLDDLTTELVEYIAQLSEVSVKEKGGFTIALSEGSLISLIGKLLKAPYNKTMDWTKWFVFWADERAVGKNHVDSNYKIAKEELLSKVPVLNSHIFSINDKVTVDEAARQYEFSIRQRVKLHIVDASQSTDCPKFDLILLSMGPNGEVASLFPHHPALEEKDEWVTYMTGAPKPPPERITFTFPVINSALNVAIVAIGEDKATAVHHVMADKDKEIDALASFPARMIELTDGKLVWFLDSLAASKLGT